MPRRVGRPMSQVQPSAWAVARVAEASGACGKIKGDYAFRLTSVKSFSAESLATSGLAGQFRNRPPAAVVIDLDKLPSHGREVAVYLRQGKATRRIPLVFRQGLGRAIASKF